MERRDGNENTERERERWRAYIHAIRFRNARARDRCPRSKVHGCARALLTSGKPPAAYLQLRSRRPTSLSLGGERESEGGREGEGRELIREKKIRFRESTNEAFSFRRRLMKT